jgi:rhodanese-related sulfurtransferase
MSLPIEIDVHSVQQLQQSGTDFLLLDCRKPEEYATAKIAGSTLIPMQEIQQRVGEISDDVNRHIVVHCHHGGRSLRVTQWLRESGFPNVQNMTGGIDAWSLEVDPSVPRY